MHPRSRFRPGVFLGFEKDRPLLPAEGTAPEQQRQLIVHTKLFAPPAPSPLDSSGIIGDCAVGTS